MVNNEMSTFREPFNQLTIFNYDTNSGILVNKIPVPPAQAVSGVVYPTYFKVNLNENEYNDTTYFIDTLKSSTANTWVTYTQYVGEFPNNP
jgi:hypothetical protein